MPALAIPVVADADVLFGSATRALLMYLDYAGVIRLHWSALILDEMNHALVDAGRKRTLADAKANELLMNTSVPAAEVPVAAVQARFGEVWDAVKSAKDTHVAACAREVFAGNYYEGQPVVTLATKNLTDFDAAMLAHRGVRVRHPDPFLVEILQWFPREVCSAFRAMRGDLASRPPPDMVLTRLVKDGQQELASLLDAGWKQGSFDL